MRKQVAHHRALGRRQRHRLGAHIPLELDLPGDLEDVVGELRPDPEALAEHVTLVAQDAHVFDGTIRDNLRLADPAASESGLWKALAAAALDDTVAAFPDGLDTPVGPDGAALSGGQRRRLSVAQGLLRRPDVLLLDEPTEGLDTPTAARLLAGVRAFDRTAALVIALHDRQSPALPWTPTGRIELHAAGRTADPLRGATT